MALDVSALVTLEDVKDELGVAADDSSEDARLEKLITRASARIVGFLGRKLHYSAAIVETYASFGDGFLTLQRPPVWSVASITYRGLTLDAASYVIDDQGAGILARAIGSWPWSTVLNAGFAQDPEAGEERRLAIVTYAGGVTTPNQDPIAGVDALDASIADACLELVTYLDARRGQDPAVKSESMLSYSVSYAGIDNPDPSDGGLPPSVAALLRPHRFLVQA